MKASIINIGNELLNGKTINTNLNFISKSLRALGIGITQAITINDEAEMIHKVLESITDSLIIITGGLGPTQDDLTKESVCAFYDLKLYLHEESLNRIRKTFEQSHKKMDESNLKQAYFPKDSIILKNENGTAPGAIIQHNDKIIVLLPGPPTEMNPMFESVRIYLEERVSKDFYEDGFLISGAGESEIEGILKPLHKKHERVNIASYAGLGEIQYIFTSTSQDDLNHALKDFKMQFSEYIVGPYQIPLETQVVNTLQAQNKTISFAESCTGGLLAGRLINVPNASLVFNESYILYSNESKIKNLGINQQIIDRFGVVSDQCVYELAYQVAKRTSSDIAISVSGIAGPTGGSQLKPIGTVYFGVYHEGKTRTYHKIFNGDRQMVRSKAVTYALYLTYKTLMHENHH
ncbi:MAG: competence/damage-inducible protein A [Candidatus Izemoplasmataceae bacterium]